MGRVGGSMRRFWDDAARTNAAWYVDTSVDYSDPDMARFFADGERVVASAFDDAPVQPTGRALAVDIGSGLGRLSAALAARFDTVIGVDVSPEMVQQARALVDDPRVRFVVTDGATLPGIADASADFVMTFTVFQHLPRARLVEAYLAEAARVLRPGGVVAFQWNNLPGARLHVVRRVVLDALQRSGLRRERHGRNAAPFLGCRVPLARIDRALARGGLARRGLRDEGTLFTWAWAQKSGQVRSA